MSTSDHYPGPTPPDPDVVVPEEERAEAAIAHAPDGQASEDEPGEEERAEELLAEPHPTVALEGVDVAVDDVDPGGEPDLPTTDDENMIPPSPSPGSPGGPDR